MLSCLLNFTVVQPRTYLSNFVKFSYLKRHIGQILNKVKNKMCPPKDKPRQVTKIQCVALVDNLCMQMNTTELAGRGAEWSKRRNWADFGHSLKNSGPSTSHLSRHRQVRPGGSGGPEGGLGGLQGGLGGLQGGLGGLVAGRRRQANELPSVCD